MKIMMRIVFPGSRHRRRPANTCRSCRTGQRRRRGTWGAVKEKLDAEWAVVKFMGQEENTELRERLEDMAEQIQDQQVRLYTVALPALPFST